MTTTANVLLKPKEDRRVRSGHPWVFSNEIQKIEGTPSSGDVVAVLDSRGSIVGFGFYSQHSLISVRILTVQAGEPIRSILAAKLNDALNRRLAVGFSGSFRLVFGESDSLPGLIIDKYDDLYVIESFTAGIDKLVPLLADILVTSFGATNVAERSESVWRANEGLESISRPVFGSCGPQITTIDRISYIINALQGQKTGFFLDQRENRKIVERLSFEKRVLDCFCADGGFSMHASLAGASKVVGVDASATSIERATDNARRNGFSNASFVVSDVFDYLKNVSLGDFDIIILDPPAFVKNKKKIRSGLKGYRKLNELAMSKFDKFGILVTCSCSQHVTEELLLAELRKAAHGSGKRLNIISTTGAAQDHPVLLTMPETKYLKCVVAMVENF